MNEIRKMVSSLLAVAPKGEIWKWCEDNLVISPRQPSPVHGQFSTSITPWVRGIYDALQNPLIWMVVVRKGTQVAVTQTGFNWLCYTIKNDPGPALIVFPAMDDARSQSESRFMPLLEDSPTMAEEITANRHDYRKLEYKLKSCIVKWIGANSAAKLASRATRYLHLTEVDKYKKRLADEGSVADLAIQRTKRFWNRKILLESSPTNEQGYITRYWEKGDKRNFFVPCLKCGEYQVLGWQTHVRFNDSLSPQEAGASAYFECQKCQKKFNDVKKRLMVEKGEWRPTVVAKEYGVASFDVGGLISTMPGTELPALVAKFLSVKDNVAELQSFINSDLGEVWKIQPRKRIKSSALWDIQKRLNYPRGVCPVECKYQLVLTVDAMENFLAFAVWGHTRRGIYLVDHGRVAEFDDMDRILAAEYKNIKGDVHKVDVVMPDTGHAQDAVLQFCVETFRKYPRLQIFPLKGEGGIITGRNNPIEVYPKQKGKFLQFKDFKYKLVHINREFFLDSLSYLLGEIKSSEMETLEESLKRQSELLYFHNEIDQRYIDEMTAWVLIEDEKENKFGENKIYWKQIRKHDHQSDLARYQLAYRYSARKLLLQMDKEETPKSEVKLVEAVKKIEPKVEKVEVKTCPNCGSNQFREDKSQFICKKCGWCKRKHQDKPRKENEDENEED